MRVRECVRERASACACSACGARAAAQGKGAGGWGRGAGAAGCRRIRAVGGGLRRGLTHASDPGRAVRRIRAVLASLSRSPDLHVPSVASGHSRSRRRLRRRRGLPPSPLAPSRDSRTQSSNPPPPQPAPPQPPPSTPPLSPTLSPACAPTLSPRTQALKLDLKEGWVEYLFGVCRPNGRIGKPGSRSASAPRRMPRCGRDAARLDRPSAVRPHLTSSRGGSRSGAGRMVVSQRGLLDARAMPPSGAGPRTGPRRQAAPVSDLRRVRDGYVTGT